MKREKMIKSMVKAYLNTFKGKKPIISDEERMDAVLKEQLRLGMLPPSIRILTPLGSRTFFDSNEWDETAQYDEAGYFWGMGPGGFKTKKAKIQRD